jgi:CheY-like chemotaxis protein
MPEFKPKILVVDDDQQVLDLLHRLLKEMGAETTITRSSKEAVKLVDAQKFEGAILDWQLPDMDGLALTRYIRRSKSNYKIPIVMISGAADQPGMDTIFKAGVNFFLQKPVNVTQLRGLLNASRGAMLEERRRYQRVPIVIRIRVQWAEKRAEGKSVNVGASGVLMALEKPPRVGTAVTVDFTLPTRAEPVEFTGTVARVESEPPEGQSRGVAVGIEFTGEEQPHRWVMTEFVEKTLEAMRKQNL